MAADAPPTADDELRASLGLQRLQMLHSRVVGVGPKQVLLRIRAAKHPVADALHGKDGDEVSVGELDGVFENVPALQRVREWHPH